MAAGRALPPIPPGDSDAAHRRHLVLLGSYWGDGRWPARLCGELPCDWCDRPLYGAHELGPDDVARRGQW